MMPASVLVDSMVVIDFLRGRTAAVDFLDALHAENALVTSAVVQAEVATGARDGVELGIIQRELARFRILHITRQESRQAIEWLEAHRLSHGVHFSDCLIAAAAVRHGLAVATLNVRHFRPLPGVQVHKPY